jgi:transposase-like protein
MAKRINKRAVESKQKAGEEQSRSAVQQPLFLDERIELIQMLVPLGLEAVKEVLVQEVEQLAGVRYNRQGGELKRWGWNPGSVYLAEQKVHVRVPRVRNRESGQEVPLQSYQALQQSRQLEQTVLKRVLHGISQRHYEEAAQQLPEVFGISRSSVSRRFIRSTQAKLEEFFSRDLSQYDVVAIFLDGKRLAETDVVLALGVTIEGNKILLGFMETSTENHRATAEFFEGLKQRGLQTEREILFVVDGAKGFLKGIRTSFGSHAIIQRCQWHKRENILSYVSKEQAARLRPRLQKAYEQPDYKEAQKQLDQIGRELKLLNISALESLEEGLEETLTLQKLAVFELLGASLKTTNCLESLNSQIERKIRRVSYWKNSLQRRRWMAACLLDLEPRLNKVKGFKHLQKLRDAMARFAQQKKIKAA